MWSEISGETYRNDLDANGHLGNSSYVEYMSHTRMSFFTKQGFGMDYVVHEAQWRVLGVMCLTK